MVFAVCLKITIAVSCEVTTSEQWVEEVFYVYILNISIKFVCLNDRLHTHLGNKCKHM